MATSTPTPMAIPCVSGQRADDEHSDGVPDCAHRRHPNWTVTSSTCGIFLMAGSRWSIAATVSDDAR